MTMTTATLINGMMVFFTLVLLAAVVVPLRLLMPPWMERVRDRRIAFHAAAADALATELARPQPDLQHAARLFAQRRHHIAALLSLDPGAKVVPLHGEADGAWFQAA
jgi:hypothetical protein